MKRQETGETGAKKKNLMMKVWIEVTTCHREKCVSSCGATSEDRWEARLQRNGTNIPTLCMNQI